MIEVRIQDTRACQIKMHSRKTKYYFCSRRRLEKIIFSFLQEVELYEQIRTNSID